MCEFCHQHGEGRKWYLAAKNYSADLWEDAERKRFIEDFLEKAAAEGPRIPEQMAKFAAAPRVLKWFLRRRITRRMKKMHFGQVVPLEDVAAVFDIVTSIARIPCICRKISSGRAPAYCMAVTTAPVVYDGLVGQFAPAAGLESVFSAPEIAGVEKLTREEALDLLQRFEKEGMVHTLWTFKTPFIGGLCNCDHGGCLAMKSLDHGLGVFFRAEYVAGVDPAACVGCRNCLKQCQFGALFYNAADRKVFIDGNRCFGCGVCRAACAQNAISLAPRTGRFDAVQPA